MAKPEVASVVVVAVMVLADWVVLVKVEWAVLAA